MQEGAKDNYEETPPYQRQLVQEIMDETQKNHALLTTLSEENSLQRINDLLIPKDNKSDDIIKTFIDNFYIKGIDINLLELDLNSTNRISNSNTEPIPVAPLLFPQTNLSKEPFYYSDINDDALLLYEFYLVAPAQSEKSNKNERVIDQLTKRNWKYSRKYDKFCKRIKNDKEMWIYFDNDKMKIQSVPSDFSPDNADFLL